VRRFEAPEGSITVRGTLKADSDDFVTVNYSGWTTDGKNFDSTSWRNAPSTFPVNGVIKGWGEGVQLMTVGEKRRFWIPQDIAYNGAPGRPVAFLAFDLFALDREGNVFQYNFTAQTWEKLVATRSHEAPGRGERASRGGPRATFS